MRVVIPFITQLFTQDVEQKRVRFHLGHLYVVVPVGPAELESNYD